MKPEQQRIALLTWAGYKFEPRKLAIERCPITDSFPWITPEGKRVHESDLPDLNDLNAVAKLKGKLIRDFNGIGGSVMYRNYLIEICGCYDAALYATAAQECEALLKTLGLWKSE